MHSFTIFDTNYHFYSKIFVLVCIEPVLLRVIVLSGKDIEEHLKLNTAPLPGNCILLHVSFMMENIKDVYICMKGTLFLVHPCHCSQSG